MATKTGRYNDVNEVKLLTPKQVSEITAIPLGTLGRWRCVGDGIPYIKLGSGPKARVRYDVRDVLEFIDQGRRYPSVAANMEKTGKGRG